MAATQKFKKVEQSELWRRAGMVPAKLELTIRRFKWLQSCAAHEEDHAQFISAVFGNLPEIDGAQLEDDKKLKEHANSWAKQCQSDFDYTK